MVTTTMTEHKCMLDVEKPVALPEREGVTAAELKTALGITPSPTPLLGTWMNVDPHTPGIVKVVLGWAAGALSVHVFGACHPTPCDWKVVKGLVYAANVSSTNAVAFSALYKFDFKETLVVGYMKAGQLIVENYNHFIDNSGRHDYCSYETFRR